MFTFERALPAETDVVVVPVASDRLDDTGQQAWLAAMGFEGKVGQVAPLPSTNGDAPRLAAGVGPADKVDATVLRRVAGAASRATSRFTRVATTLPSAAAQGTTPEIAAQAVAEGFRLGAYRFNRYLSDPKLVLTEQVVVVSENASADHQVDLDRGDAIANGVNLARDLINEPGGTMTPIAFAEKAADIAASVGLHCKIWDEQEIAAAGLGGILGVNRGSVQPPRLVELVYEPPAGDGASAGTVALVGKGVTFDSGGLSIKTSDGMVRMKFDMAGAGAVLGAMSVLAAAGCRNRVHGYIPLSDNMIDGDATRPGDVLRIRNGKTVEIISTDAEGRLLLADALSLATEAGPDAIIDLATLTGACVVSLGRRIAGLMSNNDDWAGQISAAADRAGEALWRLPLPEAYRRDIDSKIADLRNSTEARTAGTLTAGLFLREFVGEGIPWAHLDIAGPAFSDDDDGELVFGGTGYGVRMLVELVKAFQPVGA